MNSDMNRQSLIYKVNAIAFLFGLCLFFFPAGIELQADTADSSGRGKSIYTKLCVECHGRNGEGVKGKYDYLLQGNWSLQKLASVIDRTMPEDRPHLCKGEDATIVARYIYDSFYSREARARYHPPRVELARLTNRQFVQTIADLLRFSGIRRDPCLLNADSRPTISIRADSAGIKS